MTYDLYSRCRNSIWAIKGSFFSIALHIAVGADTCCSTVSPELWKLQHHHHLQKCKSRQKTFLLTQIQVADRQKVAIKNPLPLCHLVEKTTHILTNHGPNWDNDFMTTARKSSSNWTVVGWGTIKEGTFFPITMSHAIPHRSKKATQKRSSLALVTEEVIFSIVTRETIIFRHAIIWHSFEHFSLPDFYTMGLLGDFSRTTQL